MKKIFILDAISYIFRSYFAIGQMTNKRGESTNALFGFIRTVQKIIKDFSPHYLVAVFDGPDNKRERKKIYEHYKSHRKGMPDDLFPQLELALNYCEYAGIPFLSEPGVEADDLIGAIAKWSAAHKKEVYICSGDKDLCQLVSDHTFMVHTHKDNLIIDKKKVEELYGVAPEQIVDYLAIMGDASDNIPGIPGFGPKTAVTLLKEYGSLKNILENLDSMKNKKWAEKIATHKKDALMSQSLAMLNFDIPFPKEEDFYEIKGPNVESLSALYRDMNFMSFLKEMNIEESIHPTEKGESKEEIVDYQIIDDEKSLKALIDLLSLEKEITFDTETTHLEPMMAKLVGIAFCINPGQAWYIPTNGKLGEERVLALIQPLLENKHIAFCGQNIKYDIHVLRNHEIYLAKIGFDTMIASYLLNPQNNRHNLDLLSLEKFGKVKIPITDLIGQGKKQKSMLEVPIADVGTYCAEDVDYTHRLKVLFTEEIEKRNLSHVLYDIELPLISILVEMERYGIYVDCEELQDLGKELSIKLHSIANEIYELAGEEFNINSPKQLGEILFEKLQIKTGKGKKSTAADVLENLKSDYPIAEKVLKYRMLEKLRSTYVEILPKAVHDKTHRIHCTFNQTVAATGRLSCQNPNLQNIPIRSEEGKKIRTAFKPDKKDWCFLGADYSQIELRLLAHFSEDPSLIKAFEKNEDIHAFTASMIFDTPLAEVTPTMRSQAKAVNFGLLYGQQAYGLSQGLGIDMADASKFIKKYFNRYPTVKEYLNTCKKTAFDTGMTITMTGRQRPIPEIRSTNAFIRSAAERLAVNTPLQGSQADIIKMAMINIDKEIKKEKLGVHMILQIHDELIFELPKDQVDRASPIIKSIMENIVKLKVPLIVNINIGNNWGEC